jgi:hypothetical protein
MMPLASIITAAVNALAKALQQDLANMPLQQN